MSALAKITMKKLILASLSMGALISISACSKTSEQFDFSKKAPDEFAVVTRAPLEMPPSYELRPPRPGVQRPQESTATNEAKEAVFGVNQPTVAKQARNISSGEAVLLQKTGAADVAPNIRDVIDQETATIAKEETSTFNKILGKTGKKVDAPTSVVDPVKESERILINKETGKPVTDGKTPTIDQ